jgi:hypothetical protein
MPCKQLHDRRRCRDSLVCAFVLTLMLGSVPAQAMSTTHFFWESISGVDDQEFDLPTMPTPDWEDGIGFEIFDVSVLVNGTGPFLTSTSFYTLASDGGFENAYASTYGPVVFSGSTASPTFVNGDYDMFDVVGNPSGTLHLTTAMAAVPEPSTVVLMGLGLVGLGVVGRRKVMS